MSTRAFLIVVSLCVPLAVFSQSPTLNWQTTLGGSGIEEIAGHLVTADGGLVILGFTSSFNGDVDGALRHDVGKTDIWLVKLDARREIAWQRTIGGSDGDTALCITQTSDGGFIISALTLSTDKDFEFTPGSGFIALIKTTSGGTIEWTRRVNLLRAYSVKEFSDGTYRFCGVSLSHAKAVVGKIDQNGELSWMKEIQSDSSHFTMASFDIFETTDGFILSGYVDHQKQWIARFLDQGQPLWEQFAGDLHVEWSIPIAVSTIQTKDGGFASICTNYSPENVRTVRFKKHHPDGSIALTKKFTPLNRTSFGVGIVEVAFNEYVLSGVSDSGSRDMVLLCVTGEGNLQWMKVLGGSGPEGVSRSITFDKGTYTFSGMTASNDGDVIGNHGMYDIWLLSLGQSASSVAGSQLPYLSLYPSPAGEYIEIRSSATGTGVVMITNMSGNIIRTMHHIPLDEVTLFVDDLAAGAYVLTMQTGDGQQVKRTFIKR